MINKIVTLSINFVSYRRKDSNRVLNLEKEAEKIIINIACNLMQLEIIYSAAELHALPLIKKHFRESRGLLMMT